MAMIYVILGMYRILSNNLSNGGKNEAEMSSRLSERGPMPRKMPIFKAATRSIDVHPITLLKGR